MCLEGLNVFIDIHPEHDPKGRSSYQTLMLMLKFPFKCDTHR
jgi:hypothetical protein